MKVGDLVSYCMPSGGRLPVGIIVEIDPKGDGSIDAVIAPYKVRWSNHADSERYWYREDELVKL